MSTWALSLLLLASPLAADDHKVAVMLATVRIDTGDGFGSGVVIKQEGKDTAYILTANHIVDGARKIEVQTFSLISSPKPAKTYTGGKVIAQAKEPDLALIRLPIDADVPGVLPLAPRDFDGKNFKALLGGCAADSPTCKETAVIAKKHIDVPGVGKSWAWELAEAQATGKSGGPLADSQGRLIGIASKSSNDKGYCTHLDEIRTLIEKAKLGPLPGEK